MHSCNDDREGDADRELADCPSVGLNATRVEQSTASHFSGVLWAWILCGETSRAVYLNFC